MYEQALKFATINIERYKASKNIYLSYAKIVSKHIYSNALQLSDIIFYGRYALIYAFKTISYLDVILDKATIKTLKKNIFFLADEILLYLNEISSQKKIDITQDLLKLHKEIFYLDIDDSIIFLFSLKISKKYLLKGIDNFENKQPLKVSQSNFQNSLEMAQSALLSLKKIKLPQKH